MRERQVQIDALVREILGESYLHLQVDGIFLEENLKTRRCTLRCELTHESSGRPMIIAGEGVGFLDAFFRALQERLAVEFPSLDTIEIASFGLRADLSTRDRVFGSDAEGMVELQVRNSEGRLFSFEARSRSITVGSAEACLRAAEYFVNSERAYITIYRALLDARERRRTDLEQRYTQQLAELVTNTSYTKVIAEIRKELGLQPVATPKPSSGAAG